MAANQGAIFSSSVPGKKPIDSAISGVLRVTITLSYTPFSITSSNAAANAISVAVLTGLGVQDLAAASAVLALNRVAGGALAEVVTSPVTAGGAVSVVADDDGLITASSVMQAISSTSNDGGASILGNLVDQLAASYGFSSLSVGQSVDPRGLVRVATGHGFGVPGGVYQYKGTSAVTLATDTDYSNTALWSRVSETAPSSLIPVLNLSPSNSVAVGGLVVRNELSGNLCRCGTHIEILRAVLRAARLMTVD